jgi:deoxyribose-phosphate aldolase
MTASEFAATIEHTDLRATVTIHDIDKLVADAKEFGFYGVCVPPFWVKRAKRELGAASVRLVTVAGFPLGYQLTETKLDDIARVLDHGADEVDVVMNISAFKTGLPWTKVELAKCSKLVHDHQGLLKVIIETAYLTHEEIVRACRLAADAGADFVKTSTGFASHGARADHVRLMRASVPAGVGVKASGGIKTRAQAEAMLAAGANRIGTSSGVAILQNLSS